MRKEFVQVDTDVEAIAQCPWACCLEKVEGGWMCFESAGDYLTWSRQQ